MRWVFCGVVLLVLIFYTLWDSKNFISLSVSSVNLESITVICAVLRSFPNCTLIEAFLSRVLIFNAMNGKCSPF